jgi:hypothetical protein
MAFNYKRTITVDHTKVVTSDQTNFPVLVEFTHADFKSVPNGGHVQSASGFDMVFYAEFALSTKFDHEIEFYNPATGHVVMNVRIPSLSHTVDTTFYVGYGDASITTSQENVTGVWDTARKGVFHFPDGTTLDALDSTGTQNGTINGATAAAGRIGSGSASFNGSSKRISLGTAHDYTGSMTVSCWIKPTTITIADRPMIVSKGFDGTSAQWHFGFNQVGTGASEGTGKLFFGTYNVDPAGAFSTTDFSSLTGVWTHVVGRFNGSQWDVFVNGVLDRNSQGTQSQAPAHASANTYIGAWDLSGTPSRFFDGLIDELRISNTTRSDGWIQTEYNSLNSPGSFLSLGAEYPPSVTTGLIYKDDFASLTGWTAGADFAVDTARPAYVAAPRSQILAMSGRATSPTAQGAREGVLLKDGSTWYLWYDAGDGSVGGPGCPWRVHLDLSTDGGLSWEYQGQTNIGLDKTSTPADGAYAARGLCGVELVAGTFYMEMLSAGSVGSCIPGQPYESDIFTSTDALNWTWVRRSLVANPSAGFDHLDCYMSSHILVSGTYHGFFGATDGSGNYRIGRGTAPARTGPWTKIGSAIPDAIKGQPENPQVWFDAAFNKFVILANHVGAGFTDRNRMFFSDAHDDWSAAYYRDIQGVFPADGSDAIGMGVPIKVDGGPDFDDGYIGFTFDADPNADGTKHNGRKIFYSVLEPSVTALKYTGSSLNTARRSLSHDDFEAEFVAEFESFPGSDHVSLDFRIQGGGDCYRLMVQGGDGLKLQKVVSGTPSDIGTPIGSLNTQVGFLHRVRVRVVGTSIQAWLDGEQQINETDATWASGVSIGFAAGGTADSRIRRFHVRKSSDISIIGLTPGDEVTLRGWSGIPMATTTATDPVVTFSTVKHFPIRGYEVNGIYTPVSGGIYGGEVIQAAEQTFNPAWAQNSNVMIGATI